VLAVGGNEAEVERGPSDQVVELLLDTERITLQRLFDMIRRFKIGYRVELHKRTLERCLVRLAGPGARAFLAGLAPALGSLPADEWSHLSGEVEGVSVRAIACEDGEVELLCEAGERERLVRALAAAGAVEVSQDSFEVVRVERGIPRYGYDLDDRTIPQEAGLNERAVSFTKGCYVGQETVARLYYKGKPNRHLRGLALERPAPIGTTLFRGDREVGRLGSVALSPTYGPIALAILRRECEEGDRLAVGQRGEYGSALVKQPRFQPQEVAVEG
jgi:folate-binding protein YgfZ